MIAKLESEFGLIIKSCLGLSWRFCCNGTILTQDTTDRFNYLLKLFHNRVVRHIISFK
jgi:hypothetical protein